MEVFAKSATPRNARLAVFQKLAFLGNCNL
jgi:hypothetical protein